IRDIEVVTAELSLADLESVRKRREKISRDVKRGDKHALLEAHLLEKIELHLDSGKQANTLGLPLALEEKSIVRNFFMLTDKPILFAANVKESDLDLTDACAQVLRLREYAADNHACVLVT